MSRIHTKTFRTSVSVVIPIHNGGCWLSDCFSAILHQKFESLEVSVYNDASTDNTSNICEEFRPIFQKKKIRFTYSGGASSHPKGVGYSKNRAVYQSCGEYICFQDVDDLMLADRIQHQFEAASSSDPLTLFGSKFRRHPPESTPRFTRWANSLTPDQLYTQAFTSHGPTVVAPTWFCSRKLFDQLGGFRESEPVGFPEDLDFFLRHLRRGGKVDRVNRELVEYRYHTGCASFSVSEWTIWDLRIKAFERSVLDKWSQFTIWNAGKQGKAFYRTIKEENRRKVKAFCDVDRKKINRGIHEEFCSKSRRVVRKIPIIHYSQAVPPVVVCVKLDFTGGFLENALRSLAWVEGTNFYFLS